MERELTTLEVVDTLFRPEIVDIVLNHGIWTSGSPAWSLK